MNCTLMVYAPGLGKPLDVTMNVMLDPGGSNDVIVSVERSSNENRRFVFVEIGRKSDGNRIEIVNFEPLVIGLFDLLCMVFYV